MDKYGFKGSFKNGLKKDFLSDRDHYRNKANGEDHSNDSFAGHLKKRKQRPNSGRER